MSNMKEFIAGWLSVEETDVPFEEKALSKEECYDLCRQTYTLLQNAGCRPYTLFKFRDTANNIARMHGDWKQYYEHCAKYIEFYVYRDFSQKRFR